MTEVSQSLRCAPDLTCNCSWFKLEEKTNRVSKMSVSLSGEVVGHTVDMVFIYLFLMFESAL